MTVFKSVEFYMSNPFEIVTHYPLDNGTDQEAPGYSHYNVFGMI